MGKIAEGIWVSIRDQGRCEAGSRTVPIEWHPVHSSGRSHPICNGEKDEEACPRQPRPDRSMREHTQECSDVGK